MKMMRYLSPLSISLSLVICCVVLALVAELYYLLWGKKRILHREIEQDHTNQDKELLNQQSLRVPDGNGHDQEEGVDLELMRLYNLAGPPRFLFPILEETKEDLESEDVKSRRRSSSDVIITTDTPFLTPLASPPLRSPNWNQRMDCCYYGSCDEIQVKRLRSSPPPKLKFLRDAEEKLYRRLREEDEGKMVKVNSHSSVGEQERDGSSSIFTFIVCKSREKELHPHHHHQPYYPSISSQVLPLASSPTILETKPNHP